MSKVSFQKVTKSFGSSTVVQELDIELPDGSFTVLVGPSGCGKTTTLRMLAGLEETTSGRILIGDREVTHLEPKDRDIAMVFQNYALYPHLTVRENIAFPLRAKKQPKKQVYELVEEIADSLGLGQLLDRRPKDLSGGQQQRVAIGRAIIRKPEVFLFDEPLSNLDAKLRVEMRTELLRLQRRLGTTVLFVTHDQEEAMTLSDWIIVMKDGAVAQQDTPHNIYAKPQSSFVASFVGSPTMNLLMGGATGATFTSENGLQLAIDGLVAGDLTVGIRPEDLMLVGADNSASDRARAKVELVELLGPRAIITLNANGHRLTSVVETAQLRDIREGDLVALRVRENTVHQFSNETGDRIDVAAPAAAV